MRYDIEYRGYRIVGSARTNYSILKDDRFVGDRSTMRDARAWVDGDIIESILDVTKEAAAE